MVENKDIALFGEEVASDFLKKSGYRIRERNYRTKFGEIDIIAQDKKTICFIEVKTKNLATQTSPKEAIDFKKQEKLSKLALHYLKENNLLGEKARFDVISIKIKGYQIQDIELIKDAFYLNPKFSY